MVNSKIKFILASASPRRKELIGHLKVPFEIMTLNIPEESDSIVPAEFCRDIAISKGDAVYNKLRSENKFSSMYVVSADTIVALGGKIYGKPENRHHAEEILNELAGKTHDVFTAVSVRFFHEGKEDHFSFVDQTKVTFNPINRELMERYLDTGDSLDKAGAYGIQNGSLTFISKVEGDYSNVVGFPLSRFVTETERFLKSKFPNEASWFELF